MPLMASSIELGVVGNLDVVGAHALEDVSEQVELVVGVAGRGVGLASREDLGLGHADGGERADQDAGDEKCDLANHPPTFSALDAAHHGAGSMEAPSFLNST